MSRGVKIDAIAAALGKSPVTAYRRAVDEGWPFEVGPGKGSPKLYDISDLPRDVRRALQKAAEAELQAQIRTAPLPAPKRQAIRIPAAEMGRGPGAERRMNAKVAILEAFQAMLKTYAVTKGQARTLFVGAYQLAIEAIRDGKEPDGANFISKLPRTVFEDHPKMSVPTLKRIVEQAEKEGLKRLSGRFGGRAGAGILDVGLCPNTKEPVRDILLSLITTYPHLSGREFRRQLEGHVGKEIEMPGGELKPLPPLRTVQFAIQNLRTKEAAFILARTNPDGWRSKYQFAFGNADVGEGLNDLWMIDASPADVLLKDGRHSIYVLIDVWSRRIMTLVTKTPRAAAVVALLRRAILAWGVPNRVKTDNGSDFVAYRIRNVLLDLKIDHELSPAFTPTDKAFVERVIGTVQHQFMALLPGFIGHNVAERSAIESRRAFAQRLGESDDNIFCVELDQAQLQQKLAAWCENDYAHQPHEGLDGETPAHRHAMSPDKIRSIGDARILDMLLAEPASGGGIREVTKKGIRVENATFWGPGILPGMRVSVRLDPTDLGRIYVYSAEGDRFITVAENPERLGLSRIEMAERAKAEQRKHVLALRREMKRIGKSARPAHEIAEELARAALPPVVSFPAPSERYETPALSAAADAAGVPASEPRAAAPVESAQIISLASRDTSSEQQMKHAEERYAKWKAINVRISTGMNTSPEVLDWHCGYGATPECLALQAAERFVAAREAAGEF